MVNAITYDPATVPAESREIANGSSSRTILSDSQELRYMARALFFALICLGLATTAQPSQAQIAENPFDAKRVPPPRQIPTPRRVPTPRPTVSYSVVIHMPTGDSRIVSDVPYSTALRCIEAAQQYTIAGSWAGTIWRVAGPQSSGAKYYGKAR